MFSVVAFGSHLSSQAVVMQSVDVLQIETSVQLLKKPKFCTLCVAFEICFKDNGNKSHSTAEGSSSFLFQTLHCTKFKKNEISHTYIISTCDVTCMIKILLCIYLDNVYLIYIYICNSILSFLKNVKLT